jgi:hypothetical protein
MVKPNNPGKSDQTFFAGSQEKEKPTDRLMREVEEQYGDQYEDAVSSFEELVRLYLSKNKQPDNEQITLREFVDLYSNSLSLSDNGNYWNALRKFNESIPAPGQMTKAARD